MRQRARVWRGRVEGRERRAWRAASLADLSACLWEGKLRGCLSDASGYCIVGGSVEPGSEGMSSTSAAAAAAEALEAVLLLATCRL